MAQPEHDFVWSPNGNSTGVLTPVSPQGEEWADKHLPQDDLTHLGAHVISIQSFTEIAEAIAEAGLKVVTE